MRRWHYRFASMIILAGALAACDRDTGAAEFNQAETAPAARLAAAPNESWINLEGTVASTQPSAFVLDYGNGSVTVEMDDWDWFQEGRHLAIGDRVSVTGRVDRDLFERAKLEASSVFVENLGTYFFAGGRDEEDLTQSTIYMVAPAGSVDVTGTVTAIEGREFTMGTSAGSFRVDTSQMQDNPLDQTGNPRVTLADRVYVWGTLDVDPRERNELMAQGLVVLRPDRTKQIEPLTPESEQQNAQTGNESMGQ